KPETKKRPSRWRGRGIIHACYLESIPVVGSPLLDRQFAITRHDVPALNDRPVFDYQSLAMKRNGRTHVRRHRVYDIAGLELGRCGAADNEMLLILKQRFVVGDV